MLHIAPALCYAPQPLSTPRGRYLAALAEAKAAEAEYLAAEVARREMEAIRRRLEAIQLYKQEQELLHRSRYGRTPYAYNHPLFDLDALRRQAEEDEYLRLFSIRQAKADEERRRQAEVARTGAFLECQTSMPRHCLCHEELKQALPVSHRSALACSAAKAVAAPIAAKPKPAQFRDIHEQSANLFGLTAKEAKEQCTQPASVKPKLSAQTPAQSKDIHEQFANLFCFTAKEAKEHCTQQASTPSQVAPSLEERLASRLNNESSSEVKDTIQTVLSSLRGTGSSSMTQSSSTETKSPTSSAPSDPAPTDSTDPSEDVAKSMSEVRRIEAAFRDLTASFTFPAQLDFVDTHPDPDTPASSDSEASATSHLAYTSRNKAVRSYEHALSKLLAQLDAVDSFGDESLRAMRKDVVIRVERTLEALEKEVEGRWRRSLALEAKSDNVEADEPVPAQPAVVPEEPTPAPPEAAPSQNDSTPSVDVPEAEDTSSSFAAKDADVVASEHSGGPSTPVSLPTAVPLHASAELNTTDDSSTPTSTVDAADDDSERSDASATPVSHSAMVATEAAIDSNPLEDSSESAVEVASEHAGASTTSIPLSSTLTAAAVTDSCPACDSSPSTPAVDVAPERA
ncbi:putative BAG domain containing protein [Lyophyllum shimeji]|uniref:BAG domain containing protein n=1 Tax=Lyophyllum shimeji TaxID=47721 RepID=A0A9P3PLH0_LYOSH|nr:putative BAG domain containing protein [Lyophyllum shimeji]